MEKTEFDYLLKISDLKMHFPVKAGIILDDVIGWVKALDGIDLTIKPRQVLGMVGESGSGKTTLSRPCCCSRSRRMGKSSSSGGHPFPRWPGVEGQSPHDPGGLSGSFRLVEPPSQGPSDHLGAPGSLQHPEQEELDTGGGITANRRSGYRTHKRLPARTQRRSAAARGHRAGHFHGLDDNYPG